MNNHTKTVLLVRALWSAEEVSVLGRCSSCGGRGVVAGEAPDGRAIDVICPEDCDGGTLPALAAHRDDPMAGIEPAAAAELSRLSGTEAELAGICPAHLWLSEDAERRELAAVEATRAARISALDGNLTAFRAQLDEQHGSQLARLTAEYARMRTEVGGRAGALLGEHDARAAQLEAHVATLARELSERHVAEIARHSAEHARIREAAKAETDEEMQLVRVLAAELAQTEEGAALTRRHATEIAQLAEQCQRAIDDADAARAQIVASRDEALRMYTEHQAVEQLRAARASAVAEATAKIEAEKTVVESRAAGERARILDSNIRTKLAVRGAAA